jgi:hypothetical protein
MVLVLLRRLPTNNWRAARRPRRACCATCARASSTRYLRHPSDVAHERVEQTHGDAATLLGIASTVADTLSHSHASTCPMAHDVHRAHRLLSPPEDNARTKSASSSSHSVSSAYAMVRRDNNRGWQMSNTTYPLAAVVGKAEPQVEASSLCSRPRIHQNGAQEQLSLAYKEPLSFLQDTSAEGRMDISSSS